MEEDFDINAFIDSHADEDLETLTIFVPDELKVDSDEEEEPIDKYVFEELHKTQTNLVAAIHLTEDRITRDAAVALYPINNPDMENLSYVGSWFDYYTEGDKKYCNEVNLYLEIADLSEYVNRDTEVLQFDSLKKSESANARKVYSSLINRVL